MSNPKHALVMFSGGQDSATCLAWACERYDGVETVGFAYGQRHDVEMSCRNTVRQDIINHNADWAAKIGPDHLIDLSALGAISDTALTSETEIKMGEDGLPNTFVPGRNLIFLTFAAALAYRRGQGVLVGGMCQEDFSGYPDCRRPVLDLQMQALREGMATDLQLETPLMELSKSDAWHLAETLGGPELIEIIRTQTHTCYKGERGSLNAWGYGCDDCPACDLRAKGWAGYHGL
jgi:7-cyano-7-deazaguanine synthase